MEKRSFFLRMLLALGVIVALCSPGTARAQTGGSQPGLAARDPEAKARAQKHFERGIAAYKEGRFKDAIDAFLDAHKEYPSPTLSFNTARAYEKLGDGSGALRFYREYLRQNPNAEDRATVEPRVRELEKKLQERGLQQVTVLSNVEGATVTFDDRPVGVTPWTGEVAPGNHRIQLKRDGYRDAEQSFQLTPDKAEDVTVQMERARAASELSRGYDEGGTNKPIESDVSQRKTISVWTWTAFGVGVAAFAGAGAFELMRASAEEDVKTEDTQLARYEAYDRMQSRQKTARILAVVGGVAVVTGGVLLFFDLNKKSGGSSNQVGLGCAPGGCGAAVRGRF